MLKLLSADVWVFDAEWVPNPAVGRLVYGLGAELSDAEVIDVMWKKGGATSEDPRPYLKTALCQVVSVASVVRRAQRTGGVKLDLVSLPTADGMGERLIIDRFLSGIGKTKPQLVGFASVSADLPILLQRAAAHQLYQPAFGKRPDKPWEGVDYFVKYSPYHVDLKDMLGGFGKSTPSLHELAVSCGIPGKLDMQGDEVVALWLAGDIRRIVQYNECDALTTYELLMRVALLSGLVTLDEYAFEEGVFTDLLTARAELPENDHIRSYQFERHRLRYALSEAPVGV